MTAESSFSIPCHGHLFPHWKCCDSGMNNMTHTNFAIHTSSFRIQFVSLLHHNIRGSHNLAVLNPRNSLIHRLNRFTRRSTSLKSTTPYPIQQRGRFQQTLLESKTSTISALGYRTMAGAPLKQGLVPIHDLSSLSRPINVRGRSSLFGFKGKKLRY